MAMTAQPLHRLQRLSSRVRAGLAQTTLSVRLSAAVTVMALARLGCAAFAHLLWGRSADRFAVMRQAR